MSDRRVIPVPLPGSSDVATLDLPETLTGEQWAYVITVLCVMRPGLTTDDAWPDPQPCVPTMDLLES